MAPDEGDLGHGPSAQASSPSNGSRPTTAQRVSDDSLNTSHQFDISETSHNTADTVSTTGSVQPYITQTDATTTSTAPDDSLSTDTTKRNSPQPSQYHNQTKHDNDAMPEKSNRLASESSYFDLVAVDQTQAHDDSLTEEDVRRHLGDVESSFLPALSPIPTGSTNEAGGVDDTFVFDSPTKKPIPQSTEPASCNDHNTSAVDTNTSSLEDLGSSPTVAAARRTISRVVSMASQATDEGSAADTEGEDREGEPDSSQVSSTENDTSFSRANRTSERFDAGSTLGSSLRGRRPKYLRSRIGSQRSSTSSFITNPEAYENADLTAGLGVDYALQSGGAVPSMGMSRNPSNPMLRTVSMGSMGSMSSALGNEDFTDTSLPQLEPLAEVDSPRKQRHEDLLRTPKPSKDGFNTAPTDTVIARHVRNVQVPESLAKEYKYKGGLETPRKPSPMNIGSSTTARSGRSLTLKEQSSTIERLSKENFDLKLKVMFLSDRLDKLSEEGIKEMISENVELKTGLAVLQRDNKVLRRRVKELEKQIKEEGERPSTAHSGASSTDQTARLGDDNSQEREEELLYLRERVEEYATEIERLRTESLTRESERRKMADVVRSLGERTSENLGRQEEADVWKDLLEQETARREQADDENTRLRDEIFRLKQDLTTSSSGQAGMHHTTNIYNITKKRRDHNQSPSRPGTGLSGGDSNGNFSAATTLVDELRRESEQLRHENAELRREVGAQTSMLTSRNREKERLYQEIEDLKMAQRRGRPAPSTVDSLLERSASQVGGPDRPQSRGSIVTRPNPEAEAEREELENKLAELRDKISEVKLQNQELQRELEICMEDFETAIDGKRQAEENSVALQEDLNNAMNDLVALQSERDEALREQGDMENEFEALRKEAQEEIDALEAEADQNADEIQRLQTDLQDRSENFEALQEEMRKMSEALIRLEDDQESKLRRIQQLELELDSSNKELEDLEQKLMEANDKNQRLSVQQESSQGEIAFLREEQEGDKIRIGDLEAALASASQSLREEKDRVKELDNRLQQERRQREIVADREKEEVQQFVNELNREASAAKDEARRLRKSLTSREVEATEWKERLMELENNLREALGDLNGTRSSLLKSIAKLQRELENTIRDLDSSKAALVEKDRIIKQRDALLESHALESRKLTELIERERVAHRNTKSQFDTTQKTHQHLSRTASSQDVRIVELETSRNQDRRKIALLEQTAREQLHERNELLMVLWQKLSTLCGREWVNNNALIDRQVLPSLEVIANRLPGFSKNLLAAVKMIEKMVNSFESRIKSVEKDLTREYQTLENNLDVRIKKLDRLETMVRNSIATGTLGQEARAARLEEAYRQLKVENATLRAANDARARAAAKDNSDPLSGSPSPSIPRGPGEQNKDRVSRSKTRATLTRATTTTALPGSSVGGLGLRDMTTLTDEGASNENRWLFRLRDMEYKLKMEREGRNQDRHAARQRLGGLETENRDLRDKVRRATGTDLD